MRRSKVNRARPEVVGTLFRGGPGGRRMKVGIADDGEMVAIRRERLERLAEGKVAARLFRRPVMFVAAFTRGAGRAMHHLDAAQTRLGRGRGLRNRSLRWHHRLEQREPQSDASTAEEGAS